MGQGFKVSVSKIIRISEHIGINLKPNVTADKEAVIHDESVQFPHNKIKERKITLEQ